LTSYGAAHLFVAEAKKGTRRRIAESYAEDPFLRWLKTAKCIRSPDWHGSVGSWIGGGPFSTE
jgi:hypothetical protein